MSRARPLVVISGCSGGGKSTLLAELAARGFATVEEPGRRIVRRALADKGAPLPWRDPERFAREAIAMAVADRDALPPGGGPVFFDRSVVDAAAFLEHTTGEPALRIHAAAHRYYPTVFMTPPWPSLFAQDSERRHSFEDAVAEYRRLCEAYPAAQYAVVELPRQPVAARADLVLMWLGRPLHGFD